ncbi:hypothetical protein [Sphingobacterium sp. JUb56]|uniref:hypothetical protein n=1 Tax=Sphingobacterium sp. JUb56 TaxID=2587145 RepID=UPI0016085E82|nr:hypothetical protein [Sphingobacterium sp. JUb56]MBB2951299.1 natural product precursor [Sphingobacterium sp. JUb56]
MKKISLKNLNLKSVDQLSREQLKNVLGGYSSNNTTAITTCDNNSITTGPCIENIYDENNCFKYSKILGYECHFQNGDFYSCTTDKYMCDSITGQLG